MYNTQTQNSSDGCIHTGSTIVKDPLAERSAALMVRHQHTFYPQINIQDQGNGHSNSKDDHKGIQMHRCVFTGAVLVCLFEVGQAANRGQLLQRDLFRDVAEICSSRKRATCNKVEMR